ncbi:MAG: DUF3347 domain-containing protein [Verrucomicrobia bacterium]|nr:DUF3347 domain-containing protein [Verrucomicrobiota bacterium]
MNSLTGRRDIEGDKNSKRSCMKNFSLLLTLAVALFGLANRSQAASSNPVLDDYVIVAEALAKDDLAAAKKAASTLSEAATTEKLTSLANHASEIASSDSLDTAREHFKLASSEAGKLASGQDGYYVFTCPMAKAEWVQKTKKVQNPYMGQSMPGCGSLKNGKSGSKTMSMGGGCCG